MDIPPIRQALDLTLKTLERRSGAYRNLVVIIVAIVGVSLLAAIWNWRWEYLLGLLLWVPAIGVFFYLDAKRVRRWSEVILQICREQNLQFEVFYATLSGMKHLPQQTLSGMLAKLKEASANEKGQGADGNGASASRDSSTREERLILLKTIMLSIPLAAISAGLVLQLNWLWIGGAILLLLALFAPRVLSTRSR